MISVTRVLRSSFFAACAVPLAMDLGVVAAQDIVISSGQRVTIDTHLIELPTTTGGIALSIDGRLFVDNFTVEDGATLLVSGPHPLRIIATGEINISGVIDLSGRSAEDADSSVQSAFSIHPSFATMPELGARGGPGAGDGGNGSIMTASSTSRGTNGFDGLGGRVGGGGGESGFGADPSANSLLKVLFSHPRWRGAGGGGGGHFGPDATASTPLSFGSDGLVAQPGDAGSSLAMGALGNLNPIGGAIGLSPFQDRDSNNDFWGVGFDRASGELVVGELHGLRGGAGGGGAGDAVRSTTFPNPNFDEKSEDKGGAGGGGGGAIHLRAHGRISLFNELTQAQGTISANGGDGARGQRILFNNNFFFLSGAGGGGGSGGHIVLESSTSIDLGTGAEVLEARGGTGGPRAGTSGIVYGKGGDGGPGVIQLHAPRGKLHIFSALPLNQVAVPEPKLLIPRTGSR